MDAPVYKITVMAGIAEGRVAKDGINEVLERARENLFEIGNFKCVAGRCSL